MPSKYRVVFAESVIVDADPIGDSWESAQAAKGMQTDFPFPYHSVEVVGKASKGKSLVRYVVANALPDDATDEEVCEYYGCLGGSEQAITADTEKVKVYRKHVTLSDRTYDTLNEAGDKTGTAVVPEGEVSGQILGQSADGIIADKIEKPKVDWDELAKQKALSAKAAK